jgi:5-methylcytosine-specific restriction enzyme subunit McrC
MINDRGIRIKNIYYMLTYAFQILKQKNYENIASEEFADIQDLFASILAKGTSRQLKQGLHREYITRCEDLPLMRGKLNIHGTIRHQLQREKILTCEFDELSVNNLYNRILKTTIQILVRDSKVKPKRKAELKKVLLFFDEVEAVEPSSIRWDQLIYQRNNKTYEMLMNLCYFVLDGMLMTTERGSYRVMEFSEEHMHRLYEKFVLEYFRKHHPDLDEVRAAQVKWDLAEDTEESMIRFLPVMQTDIFLRKREKILIIDTKYYEKTMQMQYDKPSMHSKNLYQIFTYVKNKDTEFGEKPHTVSGMLLYAATDEAIQPDNSYQMSGNKISVRTLDLNRDFSEIAAQLNAIVDEHFF